MTIEPQSPQLCLAIDLDAQALDRARASIDAAPLASAILRPVARREIDPRAAKPVVELLQARGVAALIAGDARMARTLRADGVFLNSNTDLLAGLTHAREILGNGAIVGVDCGTSRHDAMEVAEAGADFVAFGPAADEMDAVEARARQCDLVAWWAEIFEIPCVGLSVADRDDARALVMAGADFLCIEPQAGETLADMSTRIQAIAATAMAQAAS